jgi:AraC-like DNA-binding protein
MLFLVEAGGSWKSWAPPTESFRRLVLPASQHMVSFHIVVQGRCWAGLCGAEPQPFEAGDVLMVPHGDAYYLADRPDSPAAYGTQEAIRFFGDMAAGAMPSVVDQGEAGARSTRFICGFLGCDLRPFNPAVAALPSMVHLQGVTGSGERLHHLVEFAVNVLRERRAGHQDLLLRLAELMFVEVVRRQLESVSTAGNGWLAGLHDPIVARALALLHSAPSRRWTLESLAHEAGCSRSVLAERFAQFVAQPPMQYLTQWRMQLASGLLSTPQAKVAAVAHTVGYESEAAFSRAFKKSVGVAPAEWRKGAAT